MKITVAIPSVKGLNEKLAKQVRYAAAVALTKTGQDVKKEERAEMQRSLDRPTPYTLNSLFLKPATRDDLTTVVWLKDDRAGSGVPATRYLLPQIEGGRRGMKGFEKALQAHGLMPEKYFAVPTSAIKLDNFGNVPKGTLNRILSQLRVQMTAGYESRATGSKRSKRTIRKQGVEYFALTKPHGKLKPGIYGRFKFAHGSAVKPMFLYAPQAEYKARLEYFKVFERVAAQRFANHLADALRRAMETAR